MSRLYSTRCVLSSLKNLRQSIESAKLISVVDNNDSLQIRISSSQGTDTKSLTVPLVWLRDHCRSAKTYNFSTNQRQSNLQNIESESVVEAAETRDEKLIIKWKDGHMSQFDAQFILNGIEEQPEKKEIQLWKRDTLDRIPTISRENLSISDLSSLFVRYGVVMIEGVPHNLQATEELCKEITSVHDTFFGAFWLFSNESKEGEDFHEDTAYTNVSIGPHTDGTYFNNSPGIQVFHCLRPADEGGDTVLCDGFNCAEELRIKNPKAFKILSTTNIEHHYIENGASNGTALHSIAKENPVIKLDSHGNIQQIRFNPYDRAQMRSLSIKSTIENARSTIEWYAAYQTFSRICHDNENAVKISLKPGNVILMDNYRVLHSRTNFKGYRQMCGCYLSRDNFLAKARPYFPLDARRFI